MIKKRLIGVVTVKDGMAVQSFGYKKYLPLGNPKILIKNLNRWGADEILINVIDRSLKNLGPDFDLIEKINSMQLETPIIYSGGISNLNNALEVIKKGADRIVVESIIQDKFLELKKISSIIGAQSLILSMPLIINDDNNIFFYNYRKKKSEKISNDFSITIKQCLVSEILFIDCKNEGFYDKFNLKLLKNFPFKSIPSICFGGISSNKKIDEVLKNSFVSAVGVGNSLNYREHSIQKLKRQLTKKYFRPEYFTSEI